MAKLSEFTPVAVMVAVVALALAGGPQFRATNSAWTDADPELQRTIEAIEQLAREGRYDEVLALADQLVEEHPESTEALIWRGIARLDSDQEGALADFAEAVEREPSNLRAHFLLARAAVPYGDLEALGAVMREFAGLCADAIAEDPGNAEAYLYRGRAMGAMLDRQSAIADLRRALELEPENMEAAYSLASELLREGREERIRLLQGLLDRYPRHVWAHERLASTYYAEGRIAEAVSHYERAIEINPARAGTHGVLALIYWRHYGDVEAAFEAVEAGLEIDPTDVSCWNVKANILLESSGNASDVLEVVEEAMEHRTDSAPLYRTKSEALKRLGRNEEALAALDAGIESCPPSIMLPYERAQLLYEMGRHEDAWRDVHDSEAMFGGIGWTVPADFRDRLDAAMPEPEPQTEGAGDDGDADR